MKVFLLRLEGSFTITVVITLNKVYKGVLEGDKGVVKDIPHIPTASIKYQQGV